LKEPKGISPIKHHGFKRGPRRKFEFDITTTSDLKQLDKSIKVFDLDQNSLSMVDELPSSSINLATGLIM
jgi:hypothetical protein